MKTLDTQYMIHASTKLGYKEDEIVHDALKIFFSVNKEMRESIAIELYKCDEVSMGKACEIADISYEGMKNLLYKNNVPLRWGPASAEELKTKAKELADLL
jgi:predicted HTH domain antitoxin